MNTVNVYLRQHMARMHVVVVNELYLTSMIIFVHSAITNSIIIDAFENQNIPKTELIRFK